MDWGSFVGNLANAGASAYGASRQAEAAQASKQAAIFNLAAAQKSVSKISTTTWVLIGGGALALVLVLVIALRK